MQVAKEYPPFYKKQTAGLQYMLLSRRKEHTYCKKMPSAQHHNLWSVGSTNIMSEKNVLSLGMT
jgi:hypothetical protein